MVFFIFAALIFAAPILGVLFGAFSGWVVSLFFNDSLMGVLTSVVPALKDYALWQIGATLGFVGGFFKTTVSQKN